MRARVSAWLLALFLCPTSLLAQVIPPSGGGGPGTFPVTTCVNAVGIGITDQGILTCTPVTPAMTTGLALSGSDISATGQVTATHLAAPLPLLQGGLGITGGNAGGVLYFPSPTTVAASPTLPLNAPLFGGGSGLPPVAGLRSGTTLEMATILGPKILNKQLAFDPNGNIIATATDIGAGSGGGNVSSVFGRTGAVTQQSGDYSADQVTNAAHLLNANVFAHPNGQTMARLTLLGTVSGALGLRAPPFAGTSLLTLPAGTLDMTTTGGAGHVLKQSSVAGPLSVGPLAFADLTGTTSVCTTDAVCTGYQPVLAFTPENVSNKSALTSLGASNTLYPTQGAVKAYVDTALAGKQATLGFTPEDVANKAVATSLGTSNTLYPTQNAVKIYVDVGLATKQATLGFTPEDVARKDAGPLSTSNTTYPTSGAVQTYVLAGLATKQATLGFTPEDVARKDAGPLTASTTTYPTSSAVQAYVATTLASLQPLVTWGAGLALTGAVAHTASTEVDFLTNGGVTALTCGVGQQGKIQVMLNGELQYCDGATTAVLRSGHLTQPGLTWNITPGACTSDANGGKLTVVGTQIVCASDIGGTGAGGGVASVFGRTGAVLAQVGDYNASQVTNAADLTAANAFPHASGQTMAQLRLPGTTSGVLTLRAAATAGTSTLTFPQGTTDFSATGGAGQVVRQLSLGGALTVGALAFADLTGTSGVCTTGSVCTGYQPLLTFTPEDVARKDAGPLSTSNTTYPTSGAVRDYVTTGLATKQATLGFTPEDVARKDAGPLSASNTTYPTSGAVQTYVLAGLATKQATLTFTPEDVARKDAGPLTGSTTTYPTSSAVQAYVTTSLTAKQNVVTWGAGLAATGDVARTASTEADFLTDGGTTALTCGAGQQGKMQVMDTGELQYCGGEPIPLLHAGVPTQAGLTWNVTPGACTGDPNGGKLTLSGTQIVCNPDQGGAGGGGNVSNSGTPLDNQIAVWQTATIVEGTPAFTYSVGVLTVGAAGTLGKLALAGNTSGVVTLQPQAAAGTYNFNLPTTAGASLQVLASGGGGAAPMTWTTLAPSATTDTTNASNITSGTLPVARIATASLSYDKLPAMPGPSQLLGRGSSAGAGPTEPLTLGPGLLMTGTLLDVVPSGDITGIGNCLSGQCDVVGNLRHTPMVATYSGATVTITLGNTQVATLGTMTAPFTIADPTGTAFDREFLRIHVCSDAPRGITWGGQFRARYGPLLPTFTTGTANCDLFGFQRDQAANKWDFVSTTQGTKNVHTCAIVIGDDDPSSSVIPDTKLTNQFDICMLPSPAVVEEITVKADAGTPNIVVHRRTSAGAVTPLLSGALPTNAAGALNCARITPATAGYAGTTCTTTLQNTLVGAGDWIGLTSGSGSTAKRFSIMVSYYAVN